MTFQTTIMTLSLPFRLIKCYLFTLLTQCSDLSLCWNSEAAQQQDGGFQTPDTQINSAALSKKNQ